jgi:hypothetical protein
VAALRRDLPELEQVHAVMPNLATGPNAGLALIFGSTGSTYKDNPL